MLTLALALLLPALAGLALAASLRISSEKITLIALGALLGYTLAVTLAYALTALVSITLAGLITLALCCLSIYLISFFARPWTFFIKNTSLDMGALISLLTVAILMSLIVPKLLVPTDTGLKTHVLNAYGDLGWHTALIQNFAEGASTPPQNPIHAGHPLIYPFLADFAASLLIVAGASLTESLSLSSLILIPLFSTLLYSLVRDLANHRPAAALAVGLFLLSGATLGFIRWFLPPDYEFQDYSGFGTDPDSFHFLNPLLALFLPQRSFLFGLPIALAILYLLIPKKPAGLPAIALATAGVLAGLLPLFHVHTVLALIPAIIALGLLRPKQNWLWFLVPTLLLGLPEIAFYLKGMSSDQAFFRFAPGWTNTIDNPIWFWVKNTGILLPATLLGLFLPAPKAVKYLAGAGLVIFAVANTWLFAPWAWDNFKLFIYWLLFSLPIVTWLTVFAWKKSLVARPIVIAFVVLQIASASLDLTRLTLPNSNSWTEWDSAATRAANALAAHTPPQTVIITAPSHNTIATLAGRPIYLGHPAHIWSHGGEPAPREQALREIYQGLREDLPDHPAEYILVGPAERGTYPNLIIQPTWQLIFQEGPYNLYRLRQ